MIGRITLLFLMAIATAAGAQNLTHPLKLGLPESDFVRPDPLDFEVALDNGLIAYVGRAGQVPLVTMSAFIRAGKANDEAEGSAEVLAHAMQTMGPASSTPAAFRDQLRGMTAEYKVDLHDDWMEVTLNVPAEDLEAALTLFRETLFNPVMSQAAIDGARDKTPADESDLGAESGAALYEGSMSLAVERFEDILFSKHPYGRKPRLTDFAALSPDDVSRFYETHFVPGNITLAIAGDIDESTMRGSIDEHFADLPAAEAPPAKRLPAIGALRKKRHEFPAEKLQSWLVFGHELPQVPLADEAALEVMNYILAGGHLYTRMTVVTRYLYGYTNDASGFLEDRWSGSGTYTFRSYSRPEVIEATYENMMTEIARVRAEKVTDEELFIAKGALTDGTFQVRYLDAYAATRDFALEQLRYGDHTRSASYIERIRALTAEDVLEAARKYIQPERMQVVLVGRE